MCTNTITIQSAAAVQDLQSPGFYDCYAAVFAAAPWYETWSRADIDAKLANELNSVQTVLQLAYAHTTVVGFALAAVYQPSDLEDYLGQSLPGLPRDEVVGYLSDIGVHPDYQRRHIAKQLLVSLQSQLVAQSVRQLTLRTMESTQLYPWLTRVGAQPLLRYVGSDGRSRVILSQSLMLPA